MAIEHKWYMCGQDSVYIYESDDGGDTIYRRPSEASLEDNDYTNRELVLAQRELGTVADESIIKELCERHVNYYELGTAVAKYYRDNILNK
jgi:hypothetical protein